MTLMFLLELIDFMTNLIQRTYLIQRQTNDTALLSNSLKNALTNPPNSVRDKLKTTCLIKLLSGFNQTNISFVNKVCKCQTLMLILLGYGYNETQVGSNQLILSTFTLRTTLADFLC